MEKTSAMTLRLRGLLISSCLGAAAELNLQQLKYFCVQAINIIKRIIHQTLNDLLHLFKEARIIFYTLMLLV